MVEVSKNHVFWKRSLVALLLDGGQIPVKVLFLATISMCIHRDLMFGTHFYMRTRKITFIGI